MRHHHHAVVWLDHREARVHFFNAHEAERVLLRACRMDRQLHHKANCVGSGRSREDEVFLQRVAKTLGAAGAILITGPANEKDELVKVIKSHSPELQGRISAVAALDHPTDGELLDYARRHFRQDHQAPLRVHS